jgi:hypothetical protein
MKSFNAGTLAGAGSFNCVTCGFAVALQEQDEVPACPSCGGSSFRRSSMFGSPFSEGAPRVDGHDPDWLEETRDSLVSSGDYLAYEGDERLRVVPLQEGWTRIGRSLSAHIRLDDPTVSRRHALVYRDGEDAKVLDDRSLNGVFRNGERVELSELNDGDIVTIGRFNLHFLRIGRTRARDAEAVGRAG